MDDEFKFFYVCEGSGTDKKMGGGYVENILVSAASLHNLKTNTFTKFKPPKHDYLFLDSGGFSFFYREGDYPFSIKDYVGLIERMKPELVAVLDYPCEPEVTRISNLKTNIQRIEATIENAKKCMEYDLPWVMVVQGHSNQEYRYACERIKEENLETEVMAIGSLCVRKKINEARAAISIVKNRFPSRKIHGFGIDLRFLKDACIRNMLWSCDSQAWKWNNRSHGYDKPKKGFMAKTEADKLENFWHYKRKVDALVDLKPNQTKL